MDERTHDELKDLIAAYALGAVPEDELPRIRSHILSCEECMVEADALVDAASSLALTVEPASLSTDFATRVLAAADTRGATPSPQPPSWSRRWRVASAVSIAALVVAVAVLGGVTLDLRDQVESDRRVLTSLLHDDGRELRGEAGAVATIVPVRDGGVFVATGFDHAPADHTYQLWLIEDGRPESAGLFESSSGVVVLELSRDVTAYDAAAVTIEPAGGSSRPTGRPVVATDAELLG